MKKVTALNPWTKEEIEVSVSIHSILPSGYGHKEVIFKVDHPQHQFAEPMTIKVISSDMELFDSLAEMDYQESQELVIDTLLDSDIELCENIGEWIDNVNESYDKEEEE